MVEKFVKKETNDSGERQISKRIRIKDKCGFGGQDMVVARLAAREEKNLDRYASVVLYAKVANTLLLRHASERDMLQAIDDFRRCFTGLSIQYSPDLPKDSPEEYIAGVRSAPYPYLLMSKLLARDDLSEKARSAAEKAQVIDLRELADGGNIFAIASLLMEQGLPEKIWNLAVDLLPYVLAPGRYNVLGLGSVIKSEKICEEVKNLVREAYECPSNSSQYAKAVKIMAALHKNPSRVC